MNHDEYMKRRFSGMSDEEIEDYSPSSAELYWANHHKEYRDICSGRDAALRASTQWGYKTTDHRNVYAVTSDNKAVGEWVEVEAEWQPNLWDKLVWVKCKIMMRFGLWLIRITQ